MQLFEVRSLEEHHYQGDNPNREAVDLCLDKLGLQTF